MYVVRNKTETCDDGSPFGRKIGSDILISSCNGFKTPIIFLTKLILIFESVTQQRNVLMLCNTTALFCWLFFSEGFWMNENRGIWQTWNCLVLKMSLLRSFVFHCSSLTRKQNILMHNHFTNLFCKKKKNVVLCFKWPSLIVTLCCGSSN